MSITGYGRVSTLEQNAEIQVEQLKEAGCTVLYVDHTSGRDQNRTEWLACKRSLGEGDTLVVTRIDRLGRSLTDLVTIIDDLESRGVKFRSLQEGIDTSSPEGKLVFQLISIFAEYERNLIQERTKTGLDHARRQGKRIGRPPAFSPEQIQEVKDMRARGYSYKKIATLLGASISTVQRTLKNS